MREPRGAGRAGGLLFLAIGLFVAYLVISALAGLAKILLSIALVAVLAMLAVNVLRRR